MSEREVWVVERDTVDPHQLGFCCRYACGETCIGCGDAENGIPLRYVSEEPRHGK